MFLASRGWVGDLARRIQYISSNATYSSSAGSTPMASEVRVAVLCTAPQLTLYHLVDALP